MEADASLHSLAISDTLKDIAAVDFNQIESISMMEIEVLNSVPESLPAIPVSNISLLTSSEIETFSAAIQTQATENAPDAQNPLFAGPTGAIGSGTGNLGHATGRTGFIGLQLRRSHGGRIDIH